MNTQNNYKIITLDNGLKALVYPQDHVNSVTIVAMVRAGHIAETTENNGVAHLLEHVLFDGTKKFKDYKALSEHFDKIAGMYNGSTSRDLLMFGGNFVDEEFENAIDTLNELLFHPLLSEKDIEKEKSIVFDELRSYEDLNDYTNYRASINSRYKKGSILQMPIGGISDHIAQLTSQQVHEFYKKYVRPDNVSLVIAGKTSMPQAEDVLRKYFTTKKPDTPLTHNTYSSSDFASSSVTITNNPSQKAYVRISFPSLSWKNSPKEHIALAYLGSMLVERKDSVLFSKLREENGWIYDIDISSNVGFDIGVTEITTSCPEDKTLLVIEEILKALTHVKKEVFSKDHLERVKEINRKRMKMVFDTTEGVVKWFGEEIFYRYPTILQPEDFMTLYKEITPKDLLHIAQKIFDLSMINVSVLQACDEEAFKTEIKNLITTYNQS